MKRRRFIETWGACGASFSLGALPTLAEERAEPRWYGRARLIGAGGQSIKATALTAHRTYVFHYPFAGTPCFLINLGRPLASSAALKTSAARSYEWRGGVGPSRSVVAYSAICSHRMTYPTREISFISYRETPTPGSKHAAVIHCCSEHSQYDPAAGGRVLAGPAPQPLAAILLEHDPKTDELAAVGTLGGELFDEFFSKYELRLALDHGGRAREATRGDCLVTELSNFCKQQVKC